MSTRSNIEWTDTTWNPSTGCDKVSSGCKFCYAEKMAKRLKAMGSARYEREFEFVMHWDKIDAPLSWRKPRKVFVNSMSDLFHPDSDLMFIRRVFGVMQATPRHQYQVLTKRPERMRDVLCQLADEGEWTAPPHIWLGTSVEDMCVAARVDALRETPAGLRFLSCEPLLGPLHGIDLTCIHWLIVGGESGVHLYEDRLAKRRGLVRQVEDGTWEPWLERMEWIRHLRDLCVAQGVPFFFKQWGGPTSKAGGRLLDGRTWDEYPDMNLARERASA